MKLLKTTADRVEQGEEIYRHATKQTKRVLGVVARSTGVLSFWLQNDDGSTATMDFDNHDEVYTVIPDTADIQVVRADELEKVISGPEGVFSLEGENFFILEDVLLRQDRVYLLCVRNSVGGQYFRVDCDRQIWVIT